MTGEIIDALERTRERGMAVDENVSMEDRVLMTCSGFDLEPEEFISVLNQVMEHAETLLEAKLTAIEADLSPDQQNKLILSIRATALATFVKAFGGGMALMEKRQQEAREGVEPSS